MTRYYVTERYPNGETQEIGTGIALQDFQDRLYVVTASRIEPDMSYEVFLRTEDIPAFQVEVLSADSARTQESHGGFYLTTIFIGWIEAEDHLYQVA